MAHRLTSLDSLDPAELTGVINRIRTLEGGQDAPLRLQGKGVALIAYRSIELSSLSPSWAEYSVAAQKLGARVIHIPEPLALVEEAPGMLEDDIRTISVIGGYELIITQSEPAIAERIAGVSAIPVLNAFGGAQDLLDPLHLSTALVEHVLDRT